MVTLTLTDTQVIMLDTLLRNRFLNEIIDLTKIEILTNTTKETNK